MTDTEKQLAECRAELGKAKEELTVLRACLEASAAVEAERDYLAKRLREVQVDLGKAMNAEAALEPTK